MSEHCPAIEELETLLALPADDPRRRHVDDCSRCRSLADMLTEFASHPAAPAEAGFAAVDARLRDTIAELTGVTEREDVAVAASPFREVRPASRAPRWSFGALRPAFAFAAVLVVATAGVALWRANSPGPVMRDASGTAAAAFTASVSPQLDGALRIVWTPAEGADGYRVLFLDPSLREIARLDAISASEVTLRAEALPPGLTHGVEVAWQVEALAGTDRVAVTDARTLRVP